jgi:hypothetical protein
MSHPRNRFVSPVIGGIDPITGLPPNTRPYTHEEIKLIQKRQAENWRRALYPSLYNDTGKPYTDAQLTVATPYYPLSHFASHSTTGVAPFKLPETIPIGRETPTGETEGRGELVIPENLYHRTVWFTAVDTNVEYDINFNSAYGIVFSLKWSNFGTSDDVKTNDNNSFGPNEDESLVVEFASGRRILRPITLICAANSVTADLIKPPDRAAVGNGYWFLGIKSQLLLRGSYSQLN